MGEILIRLNSKLKKEPNFTNYANQIAQEIMFHNTWMSWRKHPSFDDNERFICNKEIIMDKDICVISENGKTAIKILLQ